MDPIKIAHHMLRQAPLFTEVLSKSHKLAKKLNRAIDPYLMVISFLEMNTPFSNIFSRSEKDTVTSILTNSRYYARHGGSSASIPLTIDAELLIKFAMQYAGAIGDSEVEVHHLLLALFSYSNLAANTFSQLGWVFPNVLSEINKIVSPAIVIQQLEVNTEPSRKTKFSKWEKAVMFGNRKNRIAQSLSQQALRFYYFRKYRHCMELCSIILGLATEYKEPFRLIIVSLYCEKRYNDAIDFYSLHEPDDDLCKFNVAICHQQLGQYQNAIDIWKSLPDKNSATYNGWGFALCHLQKYEEAILIFDLAIKAGPNEPFPHNNKGYALLKTGHIKEAKEIIVHSLSLDKGNAYAYRNLALIFIEEQNKSEASAAIDKALLYGYREKFGDDIDVIITEVGKL